MSDDLQKIKNRIRSLDQSEQLAGLKQLSQHLVKIQKLQSENKEAVLNAVVDLSGYLLQQLGGRRKSIASLAAAEAVSEVERLSAQILVLLLTLQPTSSKSLMKEVSTLSFLLSSYSASFSYANSVYCTGIIEALVSMHVLLAENESNRRLIGAAGTLPHLIGLLSTTNKTVQQQALKALAYLIRDPTNSIIFEKNNGFLLIMSLLSGARYVPGETLIFDILNLTVGLLNNEQSLRAFLKSSGQYAILRFMKLSEELTIEERTQVGTSCLQILNNLLLLEDFSIFQNEDLHKGLVKMLSLRDETLTINLLSLLSALLSDPKNRDMFTYCKGTEPLLALLQETKNEIAANLSLKVLSNLVLDDKGKDNVGDSGTFSTLLHNLPLLDRESQVTAIATLRSFTKADAFVMWEEHIGEQEVKLFVDMLDSFNVTTRISAGDLITDLIVDPDLHPICAKVDLGSRLMEYLKQDVPPQFTKTCLSCLSHLTLYDEEWRSKLLEGGLPAQVAKPLSSTDAEMKIEAARILANISASQSARLRDAFGELSIFTPLCATLTDAVDDRVTICLLMAFENLVIREPADQVVGRRDAITAIIKVILMNKESQIIIRATRVLALASRDPNNHKMFQQLSLIDKLKTSWSKLQDQQTDQIYINLTIDILNFPETTNKQQMKEFAEFENYDFDAEKNRLREQLALLRSQNPPTALERDYSLTMNSQPRYLAQPFLASSSTLPRSADRKSPEKPSITSLFRQNSQQANSTVSPTSPRESSISSLERKVKMRDSEREHSSAKGKIEKDQRVGSVVLKTTRIDRESSVSKTSTRMERESTLLKGNRVDRESSVTSQQTPPPNLPSCRTILWDYYDCWCGECKSGVMCLIDQDDNKVKRSELIRNRTQKSFKPKSDETSPSPHTLLSASAAALVSPRAAGQTAAIKNYNLNRSASSNSIVSEGQASSSGRSTKRAATKFDICPLGHNMGLLSLNSNSSASESPVNSPRDRSSSPTTKEDGSIDSGRTNSGSSTPHKLAASMSNINVSPRSNPATIEKASAMFQRKRILDMIIDTESTYISSLFDLLAVFWNPICLLAQEHKIVLDPVKKIFSNMEKILFFHNVLQYSIQKRAEAWNSSQTFADLFKHMSDVYDQYINQFATLMDEFLTCKNSDSSLSKLLRKLNKQYLFSRMKNLEESFQIPFDRIAYYTKFARDLMSVTPVSHPDYQHTARFIFQLDKLNEESSSKKTPEDHMSDLLRVCDELYLVPIQTLMKPERRLVRECFVKVTTFDTSSFLGKLYLFNDGVLWSKRKEQIMDEAPRIETFDKLEIATTLSSNVSLNVRTASGDTLSFEFPLPEIRDLWLSEVSKLKKK